MGEWLTGNAVTKYELNRILGLRALQLSNMATHTCSEANGDYVAEAAIELLSGKLPFSIRRPLPDGSHEDRHSSTLTLPAHHLRETYLPRTSSAAVTTTAGKGVEAGLGG